MPNLQPLWWTRVCWLVAIVLSRAPLGSTAGAADVPPPTPAQKLVRSQRVLVIGHRGNSSIAPENTVAAFQSAVEARADLVELDYYHSADGVPVVFHDKTLDRTTDAVHRWGGEKIELVTKTLAELRQLDAGSWFDARFKGAAIPTLEEALRTIHNGSIALVEHKQGDARSCVELLQRMELADQVVVQSFDWEFVRDCHGLAPRMALAALGKEELTEEKLDAIAATGASVVGWDHKHVGRAQIEAIHRRGWQAWVYTVNDPARARELVAAGIDGIITDAPALVRSEIGEAVPAE